MPDPGPTVELFHTGLVVDDLDAAMQLLTDLAGIRWAVPRVVSGELQTPEGPRFRETRYTYSVDGPHHIELIEQVDSTAWQVAPGGRRVHHLGFYADDFEAGVRALEDRGLATTFRGLDEHGNPAGLSFHRHEPSGFWFELIDGRARASMAAWWAAGSG